MGARIGNVPDSVASGDPLKPNIIELAALLALVVFCSISDPSDDQAYSLINWISPIWLICALGYGAMQMIRINAASKWTALFWFRISTALYFGVGSLVPAYTNVESLRYLDTFFRAEPQHFLKLNIIVAASTFTLLITSGLLSMALKPSEPEFLGNVENAPLRKTGLVFALVGLPIKYLVLVPASLGFFGDVIIPGIVQSAGLLVPLAIFMLSVVAFRRRRGLTLVIVLLMLELATAIIRFNKSEAIIVLLMFLLALLNDSKKTSRLVVAAGAIVCLFWSIVPITDYGRSEMLARYGSIDGGTLSERVDVLWLYFEAESADREDGNVQRGILRISYTNAAGFAINEFDSGRPGNSLENTFYALVPRIIWPEKPNITDVGSEFNRKATGSARSSSSPGLFAESYWTLGWWGIPAIMPLIGMIFMLISRYALWIIHTHRWWYFPLVAFAMRMGLRVDGYFVVDIVGPTATLFVLHVLAYGTERVLSRRRMSSNAH